MTATARIARLLQRCPTQFSHYSTYSHTTPNPLPATFIRGGTSKGIFLNRSHLPKDTSQWPKIFTGIMGSPDPEYGRQLNGMGGGISSLSKICVVGEPSEQQKYRGVQVEYTFVQVGVKDESIDMAGNCGNLSSVVGAFAVDEGICIPTPTHERVTIRSFNTNTQKVINTTFPITLTDQGTVVSDLNRPETSISGVAGKASKVILEFVDPAGARTGKLLPTGSPVNTISLGPQSPSIDVSLIDATNPTVFASYDQLNSILPIEAYTRLEEPALSQVGCVLEKARQRGADMMGLDPSAPSQPKIALLGIPTAAHDIEQCVDVVIYALSMGTLHKAVPMTVGLCLGVAASVEKSLVWEIVRRARLEGRRKPVKEEKDGLVRIRHPTGIVDVGAEFGSDSEVKSAKVVRTGRKLMRGVVWW